MSFYAQSGTYNYTVSAANYTASPQSGTVTVNGQSPSPISISFTKSNTTTASCPDAIGCTIEVSGSILTNTTNETAYLNAPNNKTVTAYFIEISLDPQPSGDAWVFLNGSGTDSMISSLLQEQAVENLAPYNFTAVSASGASQANAKQYRFIASLNQIGSSDYVGLASSLLRFTNDEQLISIGNTQGLLVNSENLLAIAADDSVGEMSGAPEAALQYLLSVPADTDIASEHAMFTGGVNLTTAQGYKFRPAEIIGPTQELDIIIPTKNPPISFGIIQTVSGVSVSGAALFNLSNTYSLSHGLDSHSIAEITLYGPINFSSNISV
jgi:hypothetical protein